MKSFCVVCLWIFLSEIKVSATDGINVSGHEGKRVTVRCIHSWASTNRKYFCRDPCKKEDVLVSSDQSPNGRFRLEDSGDGTFTVSITDLQVTDSGVYWCGVDRTAAADTYHKVNLRVSKDITPTSTKSDTTQPVTTPTRQPESSSATSSRTSRYSTPDDITHSVTVSVISSVYTVIGPVLTVIIALAGLFAVYQYRTRIKTSAEHVPVTSVNTACPEHTDEEANNVYENDHQDTQRSTQMKPGKLKHEVQSLQTQSVYENETLDVIYGNLL